jgi:hypothetical protein
MREAQHLVVEELRPGGFSVELPEKTVESGLVVDEATPLGPTAWPGDERHRG